MFLTTEEKVEKLFTDMYVGEGKENPSMTTRLSRTEDAIDRIVDNSNKAFWVSIGTIATVVGAIITELFLRGFK